MVKNIKKIFTHYGEEHQYSKLYEEASEYIEAYNNYIENPSEYNKLAMQSEIADVYVLSAQFKHSINNVNNEVLYKINRQIGRMKDNG